MYPSAIFYIYDQPDTPTRGFAKIFNECQIFVEFLLSRFHTLTLQLPIQTQNSVAPELPSFCEISTKRVQCSTWVSQLPTKATTCSFGSDKLYVISAINTSTLPRTSCCEIDIRPSQSSVYMKQNSLTQKPLFQKNHHFKSHLLMKSFYKTHLFLNQNFIFIMISLWLFGTIGNGFIV